MSWNKIKIDKADTIWSKYIRLKNNYTCEYCHRKFNPEGLNLHHFISRKKENTRFDEENSLCLCIGCHRKFHDYPNIQVEFMLKKLGQEKYDSLILRSNMYKKKDRNMSYLIAKKSYDEELEKQKKEENNVSVF